MKKTMCELFAGVGGFRLGFDRLESGWETVWFSQWEPGAKTQWAHDCYVQHFGDSVDKAGEYRTGKDISEMPKEDIPDHTLLVGGFPCQDYSVAHTLASSKGIEGKKGVLWWQIRDTIIAKKPPFCIFENVDRLLKSPAKQRGRDFGVILACLNELGYSAEWRVVNAATYGAAQRRRRTFIFAYQNGTNYGKKRATESDQNILKTSGFMAKSFPVSGVGTIVNTIVSADIVSVSDNFRFDFRAAGYMTKGKIYTADVTEISEQPILLGQILQKNVDDSFYISDDVRMAKWVYLKGAKKIPRTSANGHEYIFSEGPIAFPDPWDRPGRTMLTSESTLNRSTHVVSDPGTGRLRTLTPVEAERLQGFDDDWTASGMPQRMRFFCMGNALVVPMITRMGKVLDTVIADEDGEGDGMDKINDSKAIEVKNTGEHIYDKEDLIKRFEESLNKTLGDIDNLGIFEQLKRNAIKLQKGVAGTIIEQCVLKYPPDQKQQADLIVIENGEQIETELKVTGMRTASDKRSDGANVHYVAKEPMSITAVSVYEIPEQSFEDSYFLHKIKHMLIVYYHYLSKKAVKAYEYKDFPVKGYEFHEFTDEEMIALQQDWQIVHDLCLEVVSRHPGKRTSLWKDEVKKDYISSHVRLRGALTYIDLAPKFPPRFRLKKPMVSSIIAKHFGSDLEQLPGRYIVISDVDRKCRELRFAYAGKTIGELADTFSVPRLAPSGKENKGITEQVVVKLFGGTVNKLNKIELFERFGLVAKTVTMTSSGGRTEDMKLFHIDFDEIAQKEFIDEEGQVREYTFEDSELYSYFSTNELLCIICSEPANKSKKSLLADNTFVGFKRLVFSEEFIDTSVRKLWEDIRYKVLSGTLEDVVNRLADGSIIYNKNGEISSTPNFMKSVDNEVFVRGSGKDSSLASKTESVNGIKMLPQYVWLKGTAVIEELEKSSLL